MRRAKRRRRMSKSRCAFRCVGICRDCGTQRPVLPREFLHASPPRCYRCGGMLDKKWIRSPAPAVQQRTASGVGRARKAHTGLETAVELNGVRWYERAN